MFPVGVAGVMGLGGGGVCPTGGLEGTKSLALGFSTNSFAFGLSLDLAAREDVDVGVAPVVDAAAGGAPLAVGGVLAGVGVLCSTLSWRAAMMEAVGGDVRLAACASTEGGLAPLRSWGEFLDAPAEALGGLANLGLVCLS